MSLIGWFYDQYCPRHETWVIFGAGALGIAAHASIVSAGGTVLAHIDNDINKQGRTLLGVPVHAPDFLYRCSTQTSPNIVVAISEYPSVLKQLEDQAFPHLWIGISEQPLAIPQRLSLDEPHNSEQSAEVLVYLPEESLTKVTLDFYLEILATKLKTAKENFRFAAPTSIHKIYFDLGIASPIVAPDIEAHALSHKAIFFFRAPYHDDQWSWSPLGLSILNCQIYVVQPWGQLRCTNRALEIDSFSALNKHVFFRNTALDNQSFLAFAPHIQLTRDESFGASDDFGFRGITASDSSNSPINICIFGGSAAWGQGLRDEETLAGCLQAALDANNSSDGKRYLVFNFAQPAAIVMSEIIAFLIYGLNAKPHIVISHDGFNDLFYGQVNDRKLVAKARYIYQPMLETWSAALHGQSSDTVNNSLTPTPTQIVDAYLYRLEQFIKITETYGCTHICGLQPYLDSRQGPLGPRETEYVRSKLYRTQQNENMRKLYSETKARNKLADLIDFDDQFSQIKIDAQDYFFDICHTTALANRLMACAYATRILESTPINEKRTLAPN